MRQSTLDGFESIDHTDPEWLREKYHEEEMTQTEMAELAGVGNSTIGRQMRVNNIETRTAQESREVRGTYDHSENYGQADYTDPEWLRKNHRDEGMTMAEMGDLAGVGATTIRTHMDKNDIPVRSTAESRKRRGTYESNEGKIHFDEEWLRAKYYGEYWSVGDMAEEAGVPSSSITYQMDKYDMDRRPGFVTHVMKNPGAGFVHANNDGYEIVKHSVDDHTYSYFIHRLVAIAEWGYDEVDGKQVHHKNSIPWDNRGDNLQLIDSHSEHMKLHGAQADVPPSEWGDD